MVNKVLILPAKIKVRPKGLHNFAFFFQSLTHRPSSLIPVQPLISLSASTYVPLRHLYNCRVTFTNVMSALQIHLFLTNKAKTNPILAYKTPIRTQFKTNLSCRSLWRSRNKPNFTILFVPKLHSFFCCLNHHSPAVCDSIAPTDNFSPQWPTLSADSSKTPPTNHSCTSLSTNTPKKTGCSKIQQSPRPHPKTKAPIK